MILDDIVREKRRELARAREKRSLADLKALARGAPPLRPFRDALQGDEIAVIAEVKRATPRGVLRADLDAAPWVKRYAAGGARAISVLTDEPFFKTTLADLRAARAAVDLPVLRKEFVIDEYQVWETRTEPADALLLIVRLLSQSQLVDLLGLMGELGLAALVEAYDEDDLGRALDARATTIGINNRDLTTFAVDLERSVRLRAKIRPGVVTVSESGISRAEDVAMLRAAGFDAILVGTELVKAPEPERRIAELLGKEAPCR